AGGRRPRPDPHARRRRRPGLLPPAGRRRRIPMTTMTTATWPAFLSPEVAADPPAFYRRLRAESPVHWDEGLRGYLLSRHADVGRAYKSPAFSTRNYEVSLEPVFGRSLLQMDGAEHSRKRALVTPHFRGKGL